MQTSPALVLDIVLLPSDGGAVGRSAGFAPRSKQYRPHLRAEGTGALLGVVFIDGPDNVIPGVQARATVALLYPGIDYSRLRSGTLCTVVEGARVVGIAHVVSSPQQVTDHPGASLPQRTQGASRSLSPRPSHAASCDHLSAFRRNSDMAHIERDGLTCP